jgi:predicted dehydrogenase
MVSKIAARASLPSGGLPVGFAPISGGARRVAGTLRVGVLGAGWAGEAHVAAYSRLPGVEVTGLWNRTKTRAEALATKLGYPDLTVYDDWQRLIGAGNCDVISIATAPMLRSDPLLAALDQGCHVLVEKPISVGVPEARVMAAAAEEANTVTASCFNWRYAPAYQTAQQAIRSGQIGAIRDLRTEGYFRTRSQTFIDGPWGARMDISNGTLGEGLSHDFDKARYLSGEEFVSVISRITPVTIKPDADFFVDGGRSMHLAELSGGILAQFCFSITVGEDRFSWLIVGDEGSLRIPDSGTVVVRQRHDDDQPVELQIAGADKEVLSTDLQQYTWNRLIEDFIAAVRNDDKDHKNYPSLPTLTDGLRTEEVIDAARRSNSTGRWATVSA